MTWRLEVRPLTAFPKDGNHEQQSKAEWEIQKAVQMHQRVWGPDHAKVIAPENVKQAVANNPKLQMAAFLVRDHPHKPGQKIERMLGAVTVARFNSRKVPIDSHYEVIRRQHNPNGNAISCFIVSVKPRLPKGVSREEVDQLVKNAGMEKLVDLILKKVYLQAKRMFRNRELQTMYAWSTPGKDIHRKSGIPMGAVATLKEVQAHLDEGNNAIIHGTHVRLGAKIDGIEIGGRPSTPYLPGAGALVRMKYRLV